MSYFLAVALALGQSDPVALATDKVESAAKKLTDARATSAQLVAALEAAQAEVIKANRELEDATAALVKAQNSVRAAQIDAESKAIEAIKGLVTPGSGKSARPPIIPPKKSIIPKKGLFDDTRSSDEKAVEALARELASKSSTGLVSQNPKERDPKIDAERSSRPTTPSLSWHAGGDGFRYLWLGEKTIGRHKGDKYDPELLEVQAGDKWTIAIDLPPNPEIPAGLPGWSRRYYASGQPAISRRARDLQIYVNRKWHWIPE